LQQNIRRQTSISALYIRAKKVPNFVATLDEILCITMHRMLQIL